MGERGAGADLLREDLVGLDRTGPGVGDTSEDGPASREAGDPWVGRYSRQTGRRRTQALRPVTSTLAGGYLGTQISPEDARDPKPGQVLLRYMSRKVARYPESGAEGLGQSSPAWEAALTAQRPWRS